ncbi:hypothetical protein H4R35_006222 [Dimargaris xerosporica]|nr:hypothetical protein H4R35_006222 [Dimargaris xerosporica]
MSAQTHQKRTPVRFEPLHPSRIPVPSSRRQASTGLPTARSTRTAKTPRSRLLRPSEALLDLSLAQSPFAVSYYPEAPQVDYSPPIPSDPTFATTELSGASSATTTTGADHEPLPASPPELTRSAIQRILPEPCFPDTSTPLRFGAWLHTRPDNLATTGLAIDPNTRPLAHSPTPDDGSNLSNDAKHRLPASQAAELSGCPTSNTSNDRHATPGLSEPSYRGCSLVPKQSTATTLTTSLHLLSMMGGDDPHLLAADKSTTLPAPLSMSMVRSSTPISSPLEADALDPFDMSDIPMLKASSTESLHAAAPKPIVADTCLTINPAPLPDQHPTAEESQSHYIQAVSELPLICLSEMPTKATTLEFFTPRSGLPPARGHSVNRADSPMEQPDLLTTSLLKTPSSYLPPLLLAPVLRSPELRPTLLSATESPDQSCEATPATVPTLASLATSNTPNPNVLHCTLSSLQTTSEQVLYQISQTQSLVTQQIRASLAGPTLHRRDIASPSPAPGSPTSPHQPLTAAATSSRNDPFSPSHLDGLVAAMDQMKQRLAASSREISHLRRHIEYQQRLEVKLDRQIARANETIATRQLQLQDEQLSQFLNTELVVHHVCSPLTIPASASPIRRNDQRGNGEESGALMVSPWYQVYRHANGTGLVKTPRSRDAAVGTPDSAVTLVTLSQFVVARDMRYPA